MATEHSPVLLSAVDVGASSPLHLSAATPTPSAATIKDDSEQSLLCSPVGGGNGDDGDGAAATETGGPGTPQPEVTAPRSLWIGFFLAGLFNNFAYTVMLSAAEEIVNGHAGAVLAADIVPTLVIKLSGPFWVHRFSYRQRTWFNGIALIASFYVVAVARVTSLRLLGVCLASIGSGWGEISFLSLTSFYPNNTISAWSSGTGFAGIAGAGWVLLLNGVLHVSPRTMLFTGGGFGIIYILAYELLIVRSPNRRSGRGSGAAVAPTVVGEAGGPTANAVTSTMTFKQRLAGIRPLLRYMVPMFLVYAFEYECNQGVHPTLGFHSMSKATYYQASGFAYQLGVFVSRSSGSIIRLRRLWPLPVLQGALLALFVVQSTTQMLGSPWIVLAFVLVEGTLGGLLYVNAFRLIRESVPPSMAEFSLGAASVADTSGIVVAALVALPTEPALNRLRRRKGYPS